ncbi:MAG: ATP-binding protein, partial [Oscillospiraceae bacterium]|nr:ATP-binding protein [Oscillospiraceae bacterium]
NTATWSQEFRWMLGFSDESDFPNTLNSWTDRLHPEDRDGVLAVFAAHLNDRTGQTPYDTEYRLLRKDGQYRHYHAFGTTLRDGGGIPLRVAGALMDITEKKRMERGIADAMARIEADAHWYKSILDAIPLPVTVTDAHMKWAFVNTAVEAFLGTRRENMYGKPCNSLNSEICNTDRCGLVCAKRGEKRTFFTQNDSSYQVDVEILKNLEGETAGFIEVVQDITDIQTLARERAEAETANQAKSSFLASMSHEIRTPMNAILGITDILMQDETLSAETAEGLSKIYSSCDLLLGIINDILDFSKIEVGKLDIMPAQYDVASLINDSVHLNMMRIGSKPIEFKLQIDKNIPAKLVGDGLRIKQILNNLLSNAFKYTDAGKVTLTASSEPGKDGTVTFVLGVKDTGYGMTEEQVARLFEEYSRFYQGNSRTIEGTGLGLAITQRLVGLMDGEIHVESEPRKGTLFTVRLPQGMVDADVLGEELAANLHKFHLNYLANRKSVHIVREPMPYGSVLIVDDVETNLYVAAGLMKPYGLRIDTVMSGRGAIEKITGGKVYDIIFMDHMMPEMDGIEVTKRLRGLQYANPIVALTANAVAGQADMFLQNGFDAFISKPIDIRQLNSVLNQLIRDRKPPEVVETARRQAGGVRPAGGEPPRADSLLMESFARDARKSVAALEDLLQNGKMEQEAGLQQFTTTVHGLKSALANIGESRLSETAYQLEQAGRARDAGPVTALTPDFLREMGVLLEAWEAKRAADGSGGSGGADEDPGELRGQLLALRDLCADYNRKGALDLLAGIRKGSKETREALDGVKGYLLDSEFDEAENAVAACIDALLP